MTSVISIWSSSPVPLFSLLSPSDSPSSTRSGDFFEKNRRRPFCPSRVTCDKSTGERSAAAGSLSNHQQKCKEHP